MLDSSLKDDTCVKKLRLDDTEEQVDLSAMLGLQVTRIGTATPMKDFVELLCKGSRSPKDTYTEMEGVITELLLDSAGSNAALMTKSFDCLQMYRREAISRSWVDGFNAFFAAFKSLVVTNSFQSFWQQYVVDQVALITSDESPLSTVAPSSAIEFLALHPAPATEPQHEVDDQDLVILFCSDKDPKNPKFRLFFCLKTTKYCSSYYE